MPQSPLRLVRRCAEQRPIDEVKILPRGLRGIYVLYKRVIRSHKTHYDVVYVGMAWSGKRGGIRGRLNQHSRKKKALWSHFSVFEVWDNIRDDEVRELEGLFRHIYKLDSRANRLNVARGFKTLRKVRKNRLTDWQDQ